LASQTGAMREGELDFDEGPLDSDPLGVSMAPRGKGEGPTPLRSSASVQVRSKPSKRAKAKTAEQTKRLEQLVVGGVVLLVGGFLAVTSMDRGSEKDADEKPRAAQPAKKKVKKAKKPAQTHGVSGDAGDDAANDRTEKADEPPLAPDPLSVCQRLEAAGAAVGCRAKTSAKEGVRVAEFSLAHRPDETGTVRTFDSTARCEQSTDLELSAAPRFSRCDRLTRIALAVGAPAADTLATRRVVAAL
ncbi:MAG: hypothetical protein AAGA56_24870, partial [Myxococcota bacterium]